MEIKLIIEDEDIVKNVQLTTSPIEYLVINAALIQFANDTSNNPIDIIVAKRMRNDICMRGENDTDAE